MARTDDESSVAEQMLDGEICEGCQCSLPGLAPGHPRRCGSKDCQALPLRDNLGVPRKRPGRGERARAKAANGDALPAWAIKANAAGGAFVTRFHCCSCLRHFGQIEAVQDHLRDVHGVTL